MKGIILALAIGIISPVASAEALSGDHIHIELGSGSFDVAGAAGHAEKTITVFYHKPENFHRDSPVIMVVPGAGRNGDKYRDAWVQASEQYGILVLSPSYSEKFYPAFWSYNFFMEARKAAEALKTNFEWEMEIVPDIGHDYRSMSRAAAEYLYGGEASKRP